MDSRSQKKMQSNNFKLGKISSVGIPKKIEVKPATMKLFVISWLCCKRSKLKMVWKKNPRKLVRIYIKKKETSSLISKEKRNL